MATIKVDADNLINFEENDELIKVIDQIMNDRPDLFKKLSKL